MRIFLQMQNPIKTLRSLYSNDHEPILWIILVFVAGAINSLFLHVPVFILVTQLYKMHTNQLQTPPIYDLSTLYQIPILFAICFFMSLIISCVSTKVFPSKMIVPPFFIQLITMGYFLFWLSLYYTNVLVLDTLFVWFSVLAFLVISGYFQDGMVIAIFGRSLKPEDMIQRSFITSDSLTSIENIIRKDIIRIRLNLDKKIELIPNGIMMRSNDTKYQNVIELVTTSDNKTMINIIYFEKGRYYFQNSDGLKEYMRDKIHYLQAVLFESEYKIKLESDSERNADSLVNTMIDENSGIPSKIGTISRTGKIKIFSFIGSVIGSALLITYGHLAEGVGSLAGILLFLAFELPSKFLPRRRR